jgi:FlaA1/EpsC-like NDP-sugar epimerase
MALHTKSSRFNIKSPFTQLSRSTKQAIAIAFDVLAAWFTLWLAFSLRLELFFCPTDSQWRLFVVAPLLAVPVFTHFGLYRAVIRYTGLTALLAITKAVLVYGLLFCGLIFWISPERIPYSIGLLQPMLFLICTAMSRSLVRFWLNGQPKANRQLAIERLLIYGAGEAGIQMAHALIHAKHYEVLGFIDDDASLQGKTINSWPVYGLQHVDSVIAKQSLTGVLLALPSISKESRLAILESLRAKALHVRSLPSLDEIASGHLSVADIQELDIDDLLGRVPVAPNQTLMGKHITHRVVMVTGAGGSIGGELCRQILMQRPSMLLLVDHSEFGLYNIHQDLISRKLPSANAMEAQHTSFHTQIIPLLGNVRDEARLSLFMEAWQPHTVYHAAAYKHVPMVEHNVAEGVATNVVGTLTAATVAIQHGVEHFVLVSTDKAVRPTNVMGATKRVAELVLQALAKQTTTLFTMVRFGNVLGSSGSVVPLFRQQIKQGGPITLTHPEVTRYFMTIPEAAQLVLQAAAMAKGGDVFVLDMGEPVKIYDLARRIIELSGLTVKDESHPEGDIGIHITGLRPGEKLYEELLIGDNPKRSEHAKIMRAQEAFLAWSELEAHLLELKTFIVQNNVTGIKHKLSLIVEGYQSDNDIVDWVATHL